MFSHILAVLSGVMKRQNFLFSSSTLPKASTNFPLHWRSFRATAVNTFLLNVDRTSGSSFLLKWSNRKWSSELELIDIIHTDHLLGFLTFLSLQNPFQQVICVRYNNYSFDDHFLLDHIRGKLEPDVWSTVRRKVFTADARKLLQCNGKLVDALGNVQERKRKFCLFMTPNRTARIWLNFWKQKNHYHGCSDRQLPVIRSGSAERHQPSNKGGINYWCSR